MLFNSVVAVLLRVPCLLICLVCYSSVVSCCYGCLVCFIYRLLLRFVIALVWWLA